MVICTSGCLAQAIQVGAGIAQYSALGTSAAKPFVESDNEQLDEQKIGNYVVKVKNGIQKGESCVLFYAYSNNQAVKGIYFIKTDKEDAKKIKKYFKLDETEKKKFIRKEFLTVANFDFGPDMKPIAESPSSPEKKSSSFSEKLPEGPTSSFR